MGTGHNKSVDFSELIPAIESKQVWELEPSDERECNDLPQAVYDALQNPVDFPPLDSAIVPGDRVAIAVDPRVPSVAEIVLGAAKAIGQTEAGAIDIVLTDEARRETLDSIRDVVDSDVNVLVHHSFDRDGLRYLAADTAADPIYLNRYLVDADFVLPIVVSPRDETSESQDLTGVFPRFADSASRLRAASNADQQANDTSGLAWQLGIHVMVSLMTARNGRVTAVIVGTPFDAGQRMKELQQKAPEFPETPSLVVVSLDGDGQQQTWGNAARAVSIAARHADTESTIVLWSEIDSPPTGQLLTLASDSDANARLEPVESGDGFPIWDDTVLIAETIRQVASEHRLLIHSSIDRETIESLGLGVVESADELTRLSESFDSCGVIRAAQFAGSLHSLAPSASE
jgi:hypothetical protein